MPLWKFRTPDIAKKSASDLWKAFTQYRSRKDFVGMDMARKFVQMGFTRARRYARHATGRKYDDARRELPLQEDAEKNASALIFKAMWDRIEKDRAYRSLRKKHREP